jgi:hypothetical protein
MKQLISLMLFFSVATAFGQQKEPKTSPHQVTKTQIVDAACGQCKLGLKGKSCDLAVRLDGKSYFVKGTDIDSHGDAHAENGFCNSVRKAEVRGEIRDGFFYASYFKLLPENKKKTP